MALNIGELVAFLKMDKAEWDKAKAGAKRDLDDIADEAEKSGKKVDKSTKDTAKKVEQSFSAMQFGAMFAGLPLAAAAAAAATGAAFALVPGLFIGVATAALKSDADIQDSFTGLKDHVVTETQSMASVLKGPLIQAAGDLGASFDRLEPQIHSAMDGSQGAVKQLTGAVTDAVENAMPAFNVAVRNSEAPLQGLRSLAGQVGAGVTDMFTNMAAGSTAAGTSLRTTGGIARDLLGFLGTMFAILANGSVGVLPQFRGALGQVEGVITTLTSNGMPVLQSTTSGFLGTVSGGLAIVQAFAGALGSWAAPLGSVGGQLFATNSVAKLFGTSLSETGFGLKALETTTDSAGNKTNAFKTAMAEAEKGGTSKLKAGVSSLLSGGINPLGIAMVAGSFIIDAFGQSQEKAAEYAAQHRENVRTLTEAIREDGGVMGTATAQTNAKALADKNAAANLNAFGQTVQVATAAINGNSQAYDKLQYSAGATLATIADQAGIVGSNRDELISLGKTSLETGKNYDQLKASVLATGITYDSSGESSQRYTAAQQSLIEATLNGTGVVGEQIAALKQSNDAYLQSETALTGLTRAQIENRDATNKATQAIYAEQNAHLGYRGTVLNTKAAIDEYDKTVKNGKATTDQKAASLLKVEQAFAAQEQAAYNAAFAENSAKSSGEQLAAANAAANAETVKLANSMGGQLPQSVQQTIGSFSLAQAKAAGLTVAIDGTGRAVYRLPDGKFIAITSSAQDEAQKVAALQRAIDQIHDKNVKIAVTTFYGTVGQGSSLTGPAIARKDGGLVGGYADGGVPRFPNGGLFRGAGGPRDDANLVAISNKEFIVNAAATAKNLPLLYAINRGAHVQPAAAHATSGTGTRAVVNIDNFHPPANASPADIAEELDWISRAGG